jgi:hypothetical protein
MRGWAATDVQMAIQRMMLSVCISRETFHEHIDT